MCFAVGVVGRECIFPPSTGVRSEERFKALIEIENNTFAAACYDKKTIAELEAAKLGEPDKEEMEKWGLTAEEWLTGIELALAAKCEDTASDF